MKTYFRTPLFLGLCALLLRFLARSDATRAAAVQALGLCARTVIPSLFPFLTVSSLLIVLGFGGWISPLLARWMTPLFHLPGSAGSAVLLGLVGGYPIGAKTAAELYQTRSLTRDEAQRLLTFCNNSNPVFLISVLGCGVFGSLRTGVWLWLIHVASAMLTGILLARRGTGAGRASPPPPAPPEPSFCAALVRSVREAAGGMLSLCAFVVLFYVLAAPLSAAGRWWSAPATGFLELFSLTPLLTADRSGFVLAAACSGWGGTSVLLQTAAVLEGSGLSLRPCLAGKAVQGAISAALAAIVSGYVLM